MRVNQRGDGMDIGVNPLLKEGGVTILFCGKDFPLGLCISPVRIVMGWGDVRSPFFFSVRKMCAVFMDNLG